MESGEKSGGGELNGWSRGLEKLGLEMVFILMMSDFSFVIF